MIRPRTCSRFLVAIPALLLFSPGASQTAAQCADYHMRIIKHANIPIGGQGTGYGDLPEMAKAGNRIYVAAESWGVVAINVGTPTQPVQLGRVPLSHLAQSVVTDGSVLFAGGDQTSSGSSVTAIDVTAAPQILSTLPIGGSISQFESLALGNGILYASAGADGLFLVDVTNPSALAIRSQISGTYTGVAVNGNLAYASRSGRGTGGMEVFDVSDPGAPVSLGFVPASDEYSPVLDGTKVYTVNRSLGAWEVSEFDVADPANPVETGAWGVTHAHRIRKVGTQLFVTGNHWLDYGYGSITVFDLTNMSAGPIGELRPYGGRDVLVEAPYAYIATLLGGFDVTEILDDTTVASTGSSETGNTGLSFPTSVYDFEVHGTLAVQLELTYFDSGDYFESGVRTLDVTDPHAVVTVEHGTIAAEALYRCSSRPDLAVCTSSRGLEIVTMSPLAFTGWVAVPGAIDVALSGTTAYVSATGGLEVVDVSDPLAPVVVGGVATAGVNGEVEVSGGYLYVADDVDGLQIFDVSTPHSPVNVASAVLPEGMDAVAVSGPLAFTKNAGTGRFYVVDVAVPASPAVIGTTWLRTGAARLVAFPGHPFVYGLFDEGLSRAGFEVLDVTTPSAPVSRESIYRGYLDTDNVASLGGELAVFSRNFIVTHRLACDPAVVAVPPGPPGRPLGLLRASPNPFLGVTRIAYSGAPAGASAVTVHDVRGRLVQRLRTELAGGDGTVPWDGRDVRGRGVAPGVYFLRLRDAEGHAIATSRVIRLR